MTDTAPDITEARDAWLTAAREERDKKRAEYLDLLRRGSATKKDSTRLIELASALSRLNRVERDAALVAEEHKIVAATDSGDAAAKLGELRPAFDEAVSERDRLKKAYDAALIEVSRAGAALEAQRDRIRSAKRAARNLDAFHNRHGDLFISADRGAENDEAKTPAPLGGRVSNGMIWADGIPKF